MVRKIDDAPALKSDDLLKVTEQGNVISVDYMRFRPEDCAILNLPADPADGGDGVRRYVVKATGEVLTCKKHDSRQGLVQSLRRTFRHLREIINTNVVDPDHVRWITLTYAENMTDAERLLHDFEKFNKRFQYWLRTNGYCKAEYIVVCEPQGRGAWHMHLLYIWDCAAPFVPNDTLAKIWGHGFVKVKALQDCDNVGAYLTAYLGDIEIDIDRSADLANDKHIKVVESSGQKKAILKGGRLSMYPAGFHIYRTSRGIRKPTVSHILNEDLEDYIGDLPVQYEQCFIVSDRRYHNVVYKREYNKQRCWKHVTESDGCPFV